MEAIRLGVFSPSVLLDVAEREGRLADAGLEVTPTAVPSSPSQFASLAAGEFDAVFTNPDNVLAYRAVRANPLGHLLYARIIAGIDRGLGLTIGLRPGLPAVHEGMRFGVDVPTSGFAFVGYALLERAGLHPGDYEVVSLGSTPKRAAALLDGGCDATVLGAGNELRAAAAGCGTLGSVSELGPFLGTVLASMPGAAEGASALAEALRETASAVVDGTLADTAADSAERVLGLPGELARKHVAVLRDPRTGLVPDGRVDRSSLETIVGLRRKFLPDSDLDRLDLGAFAVPAMR